MPNPRTQNAPADKARGAEIAELGRLDNKGTGATSSLSIDALSVVCPGCGAAAEYPECEGCGFDLAAKAVADAAPSPDLAEASRFLTLLDETAENFCFRTFPDAGTGAGRNYTGSLDDHALRLGANNANRFGVFVVVNEGGHNDASIGRVRAVFADFDNLSLPEVFPLEPHIIVQSSARGHHVYWLVDGLAVGEFRMMQQRIVARFGCDPSVVNESRVMRLPGFVHHKPADAKKGHDGYPFGSRIIHESGALPYAAERVLCAFPPSTAAAAAQLPAPEAAAQSGSAEGFGTGVGAGGASRFATPQQVKDLRSALAAIPADDRDTWTSMAAALRELGNVGRGLWLEWSQTSEKFEPLYASRTWATMGHDHTGYGAVFAEAQRRGWVNPNGKAGRVPLSWQAAEQQQLEEAREAAVPMLVPVSLVDFTSATMPPAAFVVVPLIPANLVTLLGGHGGSGKSMLGLTIAAHVAASRPWGPFEVNGGRVVYASLEDAGDLVRLRLRRIVAEYQLDPASVAENLIVLDGTENDPTLMREFTEGGARRLGECRAMMDLRKATRSDDASALRLIVADNASDAFDGDENNRRQVRQFVRALAQLGKKTGAGVLLLAHIDKNAAKFGSNGNSYSGSTAWHNSARSRLALLTADGGVELRHEKLNLGKCADPLALQWTADGVLVPAVVGNSQAASGSAVLVNTTDDADVLAAIRAAIASGASVTTATLGSCTTWHALNRLPELPAWFRKASGKDRFWLALDRLRRAGRIASEEYRTAARHARERWALPVGALDDAA